MKLGPIGVAPQQQFKYQDTGPTPQGTQYKSGGNWYDGIVDTVKDVAADFNVVERLRQWVNAFAQRVYYWENIDTTGWPSDLIRQRDILLTSAQSIFKQIDKTGLDYQQPDQMGVIPVVVAGAATAVIAAIAAWMKGDANLTKRVEIYDAQRTQGATHEQAIKVTNALAPPSSFGGNLGTALGGTVGAAVVIGGLIWYLTKGK
jgi:hypothetical protein